MTDVVSLPADVSSAESLLASGDYVAGRDLATVIFLALKMRRPLLLEGEAGVGKTEIAKVLASGLNRDLIRLQCFEGLDLASAAYEWNYPRQMVAIRLAEAAADAANISDNLYTREYLIERPLLQALQPHKKGPPVLLIDEIDRADEPFEAFLLEVLSDFQLSVPELGTIRTETPPIVIITSNRTREVHDALRRRCLYHWVDFPTLEAEQKILSLKAPALETALREQLVQFIHRLRDEDLFKRPGVAESIDWAQALTQLDVVTLTPDLINDTLGSLLKYQDDIARVQGSEAARLLAEIQAAA
ncbi:MAG: MoxR family ATPase [Woeseiaceae bacterium]|nr:MoxR family ATPase [Woeseiaceae bacterium]